MDKSNKWSPTEKMALNGGKPCYICVTTLNGKRSTNRTNIGLFVSSPQKMCAPNEAIELFLLLRFPHSVSCKDNSRWVSFNQFSRRAWNVTTRNSNGTGMRSEFLIALQTPSLIGPTCAPNLKLFFTNFKIFFGEKITFNSWFKSYCF